MNDQDHIQDEREAPMYGYDYDQVENLERTYPEVNEEALDLLQSESEAEDE